MAECLITRRGGETYKLPVLNASYPKDVTTTVIKGKTTSATFEVVISEPGNPAEYTYQWYVNGSAVSGATGASYTKSDLSTTATYSVYCKVTNKKGTVDTRVATLKVTQYYTPVLNANYPANATVVKGNSVTSKVTISTAGNPASYTYQWYKNGSAVSGATSSTYTFTPTAIGTTTVYCKVTNSAGSVNSRTATITATGLYLYNKGDKCTNLTGGWTEKKNSNGVITWNTDNLYLGYVSSAARYASVYTINTVNLDGYKKLYARISGLKIGDDHFYLGVLSEPYTGLVAYNARNKFVAVKHLENADDFEGEQVLELDISAVTGSHYFQVIAGVTIVTIHEIYLE